MATSVPVQSSTGMMNKNVSEQRMNLTLLEAVDAHGIRVSAAGKRKDEAFFEQREKIV